MAPSVALASRERVSVLAPVIGRAFADDELLLWSLRPVGRDEAERLATAWFRAYDEHLADHGMVWEIADGQGVAAWIPPGSEGIVADAGDAARPTIASDLADGSGRSALWDWIHHHTPNGPHWYLDHVAVASEKRGSGLGAALIEHGLVAAREESLPCFLLTGRAGLVAYYERRGFRVVHDADAPAGGPHVWFMQTTP